MAINCDSYGFFDGVMSVNQTNWAAFWAGLVPDCVVSGYGDECAPYAQSDGMNIHIKTGQAIIHGHRAWLTSEKVLTIAAADANYSRIDLAVFRVTYATGGGSKIELDVKTGTPSYSPAVPTVTQTAGVTWEMPIAQIEVAANAVTIAATAITDVRNVYDGTGDSGQTFYNGSTSTMVKGTVVELDHTAARTVKLATADGIPFGVVTSDSVLPNRAAKVNSYVGREAEIRCTSAAIKRGDTLTPDSSNPGYASAGGGWSAGIALESKTAGAVGNVRALLTFFSKLPRTNTWYLPTGIAENQVLAVYVFRHAISEAEALKDVLGNLTYSLTKTAESGDPDNLTTWSYDSGFYFDDTATAHGLQCAALHSQYAAVQAAAFKFSGASVLNTAQYSGGLTLMQAGPVGRILTIRSGSAATSDSYPGINEGTTITGGMWRTTSRHASGVLAGNFGSTPSIYFDGSLDGSLTDTGGTAVPATYSANSVVFGNNPADASTPAAFTMVAAVLYKTTLTAAQHEELAEAMEAL